MAKRYKDVRIGIVMGSDSDMDTMMEAVEILREFRVGFDVDIVSAHRSPELAREYALNAQKKGYEVIIAGAGGAAALPGFIASLTVLPVIGVPVVGNVPGGGDALYSMVHMPGGVPVAVAGIGRAGAKNAALLAVEILALNDPILTQKLHQYKARLAKDVEQKAKEIKKKDGGRKNTEFSSQNTV